MRIAFEQAARVHDAVRYPEGASRQISTSNGPTEVERAIASAAQRTTIDFEFLLAQAEVESAMDPNARAATSSATGLYQFIESTWLSTMQRHGDRFGLGEVASQIGLTRSGAAYVADPQARQEILALRRDPQVAALMAAGLAEDNRAHLTPILGRQPNDNELYLAHFLGAGGAGRFLSAMAQDPNQSAPQLFRRPAAANRPVFYEASGQPRSLEGVMHHLSAKLERAGGNAEPASAGSIQSVTNQTDNRPPYLIADEAVFGPMTPPTITGRDSPKIEVGLPFALSAAAPERPMSGILQQTFGALNPNAAGHSSEQVQRAYERLKAFGL